MTLEERATTEGFADRIIAWLGAYLISFVGLLHLLLSGEHIGYAPYLGVLFIVNFAASAVVAVGLVWTRQTWAWLLGVAVSGGSVVVLLASRVFGLPGFPEAQGQWFNFAAWMALSFEFLFLAVVPLALTSRGRKLVGVEQERIDREKLPPDRQETPEHFQLIEKEMQEIRARMAPDLTDLRKHVDPRVAAEQAKQSARQQLLDLVGRVRGR
ncbi:MAG: DUF3618 domain-containing protein [Rubrobacter sp.]